MKTLESKRKMLMRYGQAAECLPLRLRQAVVAIPEEEKLEATEFRLRADREMSVCIRGKEKICSGEAPVKNEELWNVIEKACRSSVHSAQASISQGYITAVGGHRIGICGTCAKTSSGTVTIRDLSSVCIRIAREIQNAAEDVYEKLFSDSPFLNTVIISPPGHGKTTMLRDLVRRLSDSGLRISLVDERGEIAAKRNGTAEFDVGRCTDVTDGYAKAYGAMLMLRSMSPDIIALDEITAEEDCEAIGAICNCGVGILATIHGDSVKSVFSKPSYKKLFELHPFERAIILRRQNGNFTYTAEKI